MTLKDDLLKEFKNTDIVQNGKFRDKPNDLIRSENFHNRLSFNFPTEKTKRRKK